MLNHLVVSDSLQPHGLQPARLFFPWGFSRQEYWSGLPCPPPGALPNAVIKPGSPALQAHSLPSESPGKPKNTGVGGLSLLQSNFPTQESNWGLLHCRWTLYQLSYQESPVCVIFPTGLAHFMSLCHILLILTIFHGEGDGTPLQYSCLENPMDRGAWWAAVHGIAKSWT